MNRRRVLTALALGMGGVATGVGAGAVLRLHSSPNRKPFLTDAHLLSVSALPVAPSVPRILFVGNSFTFMHDIPARVAMRAQAESRPVQVATAAAHGARLVQTCRIKALKKVLAQEWDVLVLQDFSTTCLRSSDRIGSEWACRRLANMAACQKVVLYPTWPFPMTHRVYRPENGFLTYTPDSSADFANRITRHYAGLAAKNGWVRAPVTEAMQDNVASWLAPDMHHLNAGGAERVAGILWNTLSDLL